MNFDLRPAYGASSEVISYRRIGVNSGVLGFLLKNLGDTAVKLQAAEQSSAAGSSQVTIGSAITLKAGGEAVLSVVSHKDILRIVTTSDNVGNAMIRIEPKQSATAFLEALDPVERYQTGFGIGDASGYTNGGPIINASK